MASHSKWRTFLTAMSFICGCSNMLVSGTLYVYALYAPSFTGHLGYSQTQTSTIAVIGDMGLYGVGPLSGLLADRLGPRRTSLIAGCLLALGYCSLSFGYSKGLDSISKGEAPPSFLYLALCLFLAGMGSSTSYMAAFTCLAKNFKYSRGIALGIPVSFFGLSAAVLTGVAQRFFTIEIKELLNSLQDKVELDTANFLLFLGVFGGIANLLSFVFMTIVPDAPSPTIMVVTDENGQHHTISVPNESNESSEQSPLLGEDPLSTAADLQNQSNLHRSISKSDPPAVSGREFFMDRDAQYFLLVMFCLSGSGLMIINSITAIIDTVAKSERSDPYMMAMEEKRPLTAIHAAHVGLISLSSYAGRIVSGLGSDVAIHRYGALRVYVLPIATACMGLAQIVGMFAPLEWLVLCSGLTGFAYGGFFGVAGTIVAEVWGAETCGQNWVMRTKLKDGMDFLGSSSWRDVIQLVVWNYIGFES
ncbi:hypothetical protein BGZ76_007946 [Entomortierella beljakovae]|nr:hypothetical protein BGZ76_007946 [Entomortierella beljakovae]